MASYPWSDVFRAINRMPMDYYMVASYTKSQRHFVAARKTLQGADELILSDIRDPAQLARVTGSVNQLNGLLGQIDSDESTEFVNGDCRILVPDGGIYDSNVQRLLALSGCLRYDHKVRSVYYVN